MSLFRSISSTFGIAAVSVSTLAYYLNNNDNNEECRQHTAVCRPASLTQQLTTPQPPPQPQSQSLTTWFDNWDYRHPGCIEGSDIKKEQEEQDKDDAKSKKVATATRHVILVRHGQYVHSKDGPEFKVLTELGKEQAKMTGERLSALNINFDQLIISTKVRAHQTGTIIGESLPTIPQKLCSLLEEGSPYPVVPSRAELETYEWNLMTFADNPRIEAAFRKYIHRADVSQEKDSYDLLVCHGNVIRYFVCRALQFPPEGWLRMSVANCGVTWISIRPNGRVSLRGLGDVGHFPKEMITYN